MEIVYANNTEYQVIYFDDRKDVTTNIVSSANNIAIVEFTISGNTHRVDHTTERPVITYSEKTITKKVIMPPQANNDVTHQSFLDVLELHKRRYRYNAEIGLKQHEVVGKIKQS